MLSENKVSDAAIPTSPMAVKYTLKANPKAEIESFFVFTFFVKNTSSHSIEDFDLVVSSNNADILFLDNPNIRTIPQEIAIGLSIRKQEERPNKHRWHVDLLNAHESLVFEYSLYSQKLVKDVGIDVVPRKTGWAVVYDDSLLSRSGTALPIGIMVAAPFITLALIILVVVILYRIKWNANPQLRANYANKFWAYFRKN